MAEAYPLEADVAFQDLHSSLAEERPQEQLTQLLDSDKPAVTNKEKKRQLAAQLEGRQSASLRQLVVHRVCSRCRGTGTLPGQFCFRAWQRAAS